MVLSQQHRSTIHTKLAPVIGDEEAAALLSHFPAREGDEPVTRDFLRAELAEIRTEIRGEMHDQGNLLRAEMHDHLRQMMVWTVTALLGGLSVGMGLAAGIASAIAG